MGWLSMTPEGMGGHATPKAYLDAQFTYSPSQTEGREHGGMRVLKSVWSGSVYYAAAQRYTEAGEGLAVFAMVCLVRWNPRAADRYVFAYKDSAPLWR